jgi:hypothetical protein
MSDVDNFFGEEPKQEIMEHPKAKPTPRERAKAYRLKKLKEDPDWDKKRMKRYRETHSETFNMIMARYWIKKLTPEQKRSLHDVEEKN